MVVQRSLGEVGNPVSQNDICNRRFATGFYMCRSYIGGGSSAGDAWSMIFPFRSASTAVSISAAHNLDMGWLIARQFTLEELSFGVTKRTLSGPAVPSATGQLDLEKIDQTSGSPTLVGRCQGSFPREYQTFQNNTNVIRSGLLGLQFKTTERVTADVSDYNIHVYMRGFFG